VTASGGIIQLISTKIRRLFQGLARGTRSVEGRRVKKKPSQRRLQSVFDSAAKDDGIAEPRGGDGRHQENRQAIWRVIVRHCRRGNLLEPGGRVEEQDDNGRKGDPPASALEGRIGKGILDLLNSRKKKLRWEGTSARWA